MWLANGAGAAECANPPSRAGSGYWDYIEACGCARLDPPSRASQDHQRYLKACSQWRQRNQPAHVVAPQGDPARGGRSAAPECANPPSRAAEGYWDYVEACGCARLDAPSSASPDHERFMQACSQWRQRNPHLEAAPDEGTRPAPVEEPKPEPEPTVSPDPGGSSSLR